MFELPSGLCVFSQPFLVSGVPKFNRFTACMAETLLDVTQIHALPRQQGRKFSTTPKDTPSTFSPYLSPQCHRQKNLKASIRNALRFTCVIKYYNDLNAKQLQD